jgi:hypothetical protein
VFGAGDVENVSELIYDRQRLHRDGVLSVAYQEQSATPNAPSAFRVADFRLDTRRPSRERATEPEDPPVPYEGSAPAWPRATASSAQPAYPPDLAVDGSLATFWVSGGTGPADAPSPADPETLTIEYGRTVAIGSVTVSPRVNWGPRTFAIEARTPSGWTRLADVEQANAAATHDVADSQADALRLVITSSYDGQFAPDTGNVQVAEVAIAP